MKRNRTTGPGSSLETPPPAFDEAGAAANAKRVFGIEGDARELAIDRPD